MAEKLAPRVKVAMKKDLACKDVACHHGPVLSAERFREIPHRPETLRLTLPSDDLRIATNFPQLPTDVLSGQPPPTDGKLCPGLDCILLGDVDEFMLPTGSLCSARALIAWSELVLFASVGGGFATGAW